MLRNQPATVKVSRHNLQEMQQRKYISEFETVDGNRVHYHFEANNLQEAKKKTYKEAYIYQVNSLPDEIQDALKGKRKTVDVWELLSNYGDGWDVETCNYNRKEARQELRDYQQNSRGSHKLRKRRIKRFSIIQYLNN